MSFFVELEDGLLMNTGNIKTAAVKFNRSGAEHSVTITFIDGKDISVRVPFATVKAILTARDKQAIPTTSAAQVRP
jgi:hypothetical protein